MKPAMALKSFITYIKEIGPGTEVSYGGTFKADRTMRIATVSAGYGDGYPRNLSGRGEVLIHGKRAKILGRVCMDQFMVDLTGIPEAKEGDLVTLIGRDGEEGDHDGGDRRGFRRLPLRDPVSDRKAGSACVCEERKGPRDHELPG